MKSPHTYLRYGYEPSSKTYYLYNIGTPNVNDRNKGYARQMLEIFFTMIRNSSGKLHIDAYTSAGMAYIKPVVSKLSKEYGVRLV